MAVPRDVMIGGKIVPSIKPICVIALLIATIIGGKATPTDATTELIALPKAVIAGAVAPIATPTATTKGARLANALVTTGNTPETVTIA